MDRSGLWNWFVIFLFGFLKALKADSATCETTASVTTSNIWPAVSNGPDMASVRSIRSRGGPGFWLEIDAPMIELAEIANNI